MLKAIFLPLQQEPGKVETHDVCGKEIFRKYLWLVDLHFDHMDWTTLPLLACFFQGRTLVGVVELADQRRGPVTPARREIPSETVRLLIEHHIQFFSCDQHVSQRLECELQCHWYIRDGI